MIGCLDRRGKEERNRRVASAVTERRRGITNAVVDRGGEGKGQGVEKRSHENAGEKVLCVAAGAAVALAGWLAGSRELS